MPLLSDEFQERKRLQYAMIGGAEGAFFAQYHRAAARLSNCWELTAGAFSSDAKKAKTAGAVLQVADDRTYGSFEELAEKEPQRTDPVDAVVVVTPNHTHFQICKALLEAGLNVICDKPLVNDLNEARELHALANRKKCFFGMTYSYVGFPMVREARSRVLGGDLGEIKVAYAEYLQEWLAEKPENLGAKHAQWRTDPAQAGPTGTLGDVGTHAFNLIEFVIGQRCERVSATMSTLVPGRRLDDNDFVVMRMSEGAQGLLWSCQAAPGHRNGLRLKVVGTKGTLEWRQEYPEQLFIGMLGEPDQILHRGQRQVTDDATRSTTLPAGNPEGYLEALGVLYTDFAARISRAETAGSPLPDAYEGLRGVAFINACLVSSKADSAWSAVLDV